MKDVRLADKYVRKAQRAKDKGQEFALTFAQYKKLVAAKRCKYTGVKLTQHMPGTPAKSTDVTLDRVDNTKGYTIANVVPCCHAANKIKSVWENPQNILTAEMVIRIAGYQS